MEKTIEHRKTENQIKDFVPAMEIISESVDLKKMWSNYQSQFAYAKDISFEDTCNEIKRLIVEIK